MFVWFEMYDHYRRANQWPDGGALLSQPSVAVHVFQVIGHQIGKEEARGKRS